MELVKQYLSQCISSASNNLRLSTQKIEATVILKDAINNSTNLEADFKEMKKITELSTLAIRLNEIYNYLTQNPVDFIKISDKFKEHSKYLIRDLSHMLDYVSPQTLQGSLNKMKKNEEISIKEEPAPVEVNSTKKNYEYEINRVEKEKEAIRSNEEIKVNFILEEDRQDPDEQLLNFESNILKPINPLNSFLHDLVQNDFSDEEIIEYIEVFKKNEELSKRIGVQILIDMHKIIVKSLEMILLKTLSPEKEVAESMRACLIVIAAIVKGKEVDIKEFLIKTEQFYNELLNL